MRGAFHCLEMVGWYIPRLAKPELEEIDRQ